MALRFSSKKNRPWINYLLIVLAFAVLVCAIYLFFKCRLKTIDEESKPTNGLINKQIPAKGALSVE
jgi:uncharacterized protein YoxC